MLARCFDDSAAFGYFATISELRLAMKDVDARI